MRQVEIQLRILAHGAGLPAPTCETPGAAGADLRAALPEDAPATLAPGARALIPTGVAMALPMGWEAQVRPRSGLALKHGVTTLNAPGTIDADYRGEIGVILINHGDAPFTVTRGMRIAQIVLAEAPRPRWRMTEALDETARGAGGFGSSGGIGGADPVANPMADPVKE